MLCVGMPLGTLCVPQRHSRTDAVADCIDFDTANPMRKDQTRFRKLSFSDGENPYDFADLPKQYGLEVFELAGLYKAVDDKSR
ncbi:hypothetical protein QF043_003454 [Pseudomonas sp. W3I7]|nr:hypothetical protein [Pseudomonas sp. W3I7]